MKKKIYSLRLYYPHDIDLLSFIETYDIDFSKTASDILRAFFEQRFFVLHPEPRSEPFTGTRKRICRKELILDEDDEQDQKIISCLSSIRKGCINNFVKNLFRLYLCMPISRNELNWTRPEAEEILSLFTSFQKEKIEVQISDSPEKDGAEMDENKDKAIQDEPVTEKEEKMEISEQVDRLEKTEQMDELDKVGEPEEADDQNIADDNFLTDLFSSLIM